MREEGEKTETEEGSDRNGNVIPYQGGFSTPPPQLFSFLFEGCARVLCDLENSSSVLSIICICSVPLGFLLWRPYF